MLPQAVSDHYRAQQRLIVSTLALTRREWSAMGDDLDASWARVGPRLALLTASAQVGAARAGTSYVSDALDEQELPSTATARTNPAAFSGVASTLDGLTYGSLDDLLYGAVVHARTAPAESLRERLDAGGKWLDALVHTQVADAARMAASTTIAATTGAGWVRMVNPPCCQRCAVLAGKFFKSNEGFDRHPRCDCRHVPTSEAKAGDVGILIGPDDVKDLSAAQRKAIDDGADFNKVINSRRVYKNRDGSFTPARSKDRMTTTAFGRRKLTPEGIYKVSATREEALKRLRDNGYFL